MKKLMVFAAMAAAMTFIACGDDDSASASGSCTVKSTDNSATATMSAAGITTTSTFTLTEDGYKITYGGYGSEGMEPIEVPNKNITKDDLVKMANKVCSMEE